MFKEILVLFVVVMALTMAYPEDETPKTENPDARKTRPQWVEDEGLSTAESANPIFYGGFYGGYRPVFYGGYRPYYGGYGYGGYGYGGYPYYGGYKSHYWG